MEKIIIKGIYRHYRGNLYLVEDIAIDTETGEKRVVYRALYGKRLLYTQPFSRFLEKISIPARKYRGLRMTFVDIKEKK